MEVWLRGDLPGILPLLQPVAHALLQAKEEVTDLMHQFPDELLWESPAGLATPGFHLQHLTGVADRLFTYAKGEALNQEQLQRLASEKEPPFPGCGSRQLVESFNRQVNKCVDTLKTITEDSLTVAREVGRAKLPSTVIGLLVHSAEHTMRHVGQLLVTVRILKSGR